MTTKLCSKCRATLPVEDFYGTVKGGRQSSCKQCVKAAVRANYRKNREHYQAYEFNRSQQPERKAYARAASLRHYDAHPLKRAARTTLNNAVRDGLVAKLPCEVCGARAEAHHDDYSKPLQVRWLCKQHHWEQHDSEHGAPHGG